MNLNQAAQLVGRNRRTLYNWIKLGWLQTQPSTGHSAQVSRDDVIRALRQAEDKIAATQYKKKV